jgi:hypothetical protein
LRYEEAKLHSRGSVDEQDGGMIRRITFLYYIGWDDFPLAIFQVLPLIWAIFTNPEASLEYVAVAGLVGKTEPMLCGRVHFLHVEPFVMRHRWIVCISAARLPVGIRSPRDELAIARQQFVLFTPRETCPLLLKHMGGWAFFHSAVRVLAATAGGERAATPAPRRAATAGRKIKTQICVLIESRRRCSAHPGVTLLDGLVVEEFSGKLCGGLRWPIWMSE